VWASWLAGATRMPWRSFLLWNALGGIAWATAIGIAAFLLGRSAGGAIEAFGLYGLVAVAIAISSAVVAHRRHRRRTAARPGAAPGAPSDGALTARGASETKPDRPD
jgi:membrane-associated protein